MNQLSNEVKSSIEVRFHKYFIKRIKFKNPYLLDWCAKQRMLEYLIYAYENGCTWDDRTYHYVVFQGHIDCLQYLHENGCPWDEYTCYYAAFNGQLKCLRYALQNGCPYDKSKCIQEAKDREAVAALFEELDL